MRGDQRFVAEGGEQRLRHRPQLQDPQETDVQLRGTVEEQADPVQGPDAPARQECGPAGGQLLEIGESVGPEGAAMALVDQGGFVPQSTLHVSVGAEVTNIDRTARGQIQVAQGIVPVQFSAHSLPSCSGVCRTDHDSGKIFLFKIPWMQERLQHRDCAFPVRFLHYRPSAPELQEMGELGRPTRPAGQGESSGP